MDLTFQVPMQYCSLQHQTLLPSPVTPTPGCYFRFGSISSFFLVLFLRWSPLANWAPTNLGSSSFSVVSDKIEGEVSTGEIMIWGGWTRPAGPRRPQLGIGLLSQSKRKASKRFQAEAGWGQWKEEVMWTGLHSRTTTRFCAESGLKSKEEAINACMWNLEKEYRWSYLQSRNRDRSREQTYGHQGVDNGGWEGLGDGHWHINTIEKLMTTDCAAQGTRLGALQGPKWEGNPKERGHMCVYGWFILLHSALQ